MSYWHCQGAFAGASEQESNDLEFQEVEQVIIIGVDYYDGQ